jgi:hypothetical protein
MSDRIRLSDADRDRAAAELAEHYAEGRLTTDEHAERLDAIWTARTRADLAPIFDDLPRRAPEPPARGRRPRGSVPFVPIAAALIVLSILTHLPFWILIFFIGCGLFTRRRARAWRSEEWSRYSSPARG